MLLVARIIPKQRQKAGGRSRSDVCSSGTAEGERGQGRRGFNERKNDRRGTAEYPGIQFEEYGTVTVDQLKGEEVQKYDAKRTRIMMIIFGGQLILYLVSSGRLRVHHSSTQNSLAAADPLLPLFLLLSFLD